MAAIILDELALRGGRVEVGYPRGERHIFPTVEAPLPEVFETASTPQTVLATGGARGITAETLRSVAAPGMTLLLTGRSPMPSEAEALRSDDTLAALTAEQPLAKHFAKVEKMALGEARKRASKVIAAREMLDNVADLTARGAEVRYLAVDVTDGAALAALVSEHGPIDTVVHGAGVIEDKFLGDITSGSWDRVVRTKVIGLLQMLSALDLGKLTSLIVYTSVAGRYGNAGQTSYATANELMNRLCCQLQAQLGDGVAVRGMNWGPWGPTQFGAGMVTPETEAKFRAQGVHLVTAQQGRDLFAHAVHSRDNAQVEIVCGAAPWDAAEAGRSGFVPAKVQLIDDTAPQALTADTLVQTLSIAEMTPFLDDHRIDGTPVLPMAMALEMMAQSVVRSFGEGWKLIAIEEAKLFGGVQMDTPSRDMLVRMVQKSHGMGETQTVSAKLFSAAAPKRPHYGAEFVLAPTMPDAMPAPLFTGTGEGAARAALYPQHLFHGPAFQMLSAVEGVGQHGLRARMDTAKPSLLLGGESDLSWQFDPLLVDGIAQLPLAWISILHGREVLPLQFERIERFAADFGPELILDMTVTEHSPEAVISDVIAHEPGGRVVMAVTGMRHAIRPQREASVAQGDAA